MESKYLSKFSKVSVATLPLRGNRMLVEVLPKIENKTASGLVISSDLNDHRSSTEQNRAELAIVLAVGSGYYDEETGSDVPMDIEVGSVVLISRMGLKLYSQFPGLAEYTKESIALTRDNEIHISWPSIEAYEKYVAALNA